MRLESKMEMAELLPLKCLSILLKESGVVDDCSVVISVLFSQADISFIEKQ